MKAKVIVGLLGLCIAVGVLGLVAWQKHRRDVAATWPTVQGVITRAEIESAGTRKNNRPDGTTIVIGSGDTQDRHKSRVTNWRIAVHYEYTVGAIRYPGRTGDLGAQTTRRAEAERQLERFPAGSALTVHYNPQDPAESMVLH